MQNNYGMVVEFTNITDKDFQHGWGGQLFFVKAGETMMLPYDLAEHLAKHLARKILLEKDTTVFDPKNPQNNVQKALWNEDSERDMIQKILGNSYKKEMPKEKSELEILKERVEELNKKILEPEMKKAELSEKYLDKKEVIDELEKKGIAYDARQSKSKLEELLNKTDE